MTQEEMQDSISALVGEASARFGASNPARVYQLTETCQSVSMMIDALFTEVPYRVGNL